jgi:hypothetical protein
MKIKSERREMKQKRKMKSSIKTSRLAKCMTSHKVRRLRYVCTCMHAQALADIRGCQ